MIRILAIICLLFSASCSQSSTPQGSKTQDKIPSITLEQDQAFKKQRQKMVQDQLLTRDITNKQVLKVMGQIPRHLFVPQNLMDDAYKDFPLPIGEGQTISQPYVVAYMTQILNFKGNENVLEIGTGSGYQAAVLSQIVPKVYTIEIRPPLAVDATARLNRLNYDNVEVKNADGYFGWAEKGPFDVIMITAATNHVPPPLLKQLKPNGKLILPLGSTDFFQTLTLIKKTKGKPVATHLMDVRFVPLIGRARE